MCTYFTDPNLIAFIVAVTPIPDAVQLSFEFIDPPLKLVQGNVAARAYEELERNRRAA